MPGKTTVTVYDDVNQQPAVGIEYDLWRRLDNNNRVQIKHDRITGPNPHILIQANSAEDLGSFEVVLFTKDYYEHLARKPSTENERLVVPFGVGQLDEDYNLGISITSTGVTCVL